MDSAIANRLFFTIKAIFYTVLTQTDAVSLQDNLGMSVKDIREYLQEKHQGMLKNNDIPAYKQKDYQEALLASDKEYQTLLDKHYDPLDFDLFIASQTDNGVCYALNRNIFKELVYYCIKPNQEIDEATLNQYIGRLVQVALSQNSGGVQR